MHAGLLTEDTTAEFHRLISTDAEAQEMLAALDATQHDLSALPPLPMPDDVAARIDAALASEVGRRGDGGPQPAGPAPIPPQVGALSGTSPAADTGGAQVVSIDRARRRRNQRLGWGAGILAAAAVAVGVTVVSLPGGGQTGTPQAGQTQTPSGTGSQTGGSTGPLALNSNQLGSAFGQVNSVTEYGPMENPEKLGACLQAVGIPGTSKPLGVREITLRDGNGQNGKDAVLVLLPGGGPVPGKFRMVVVGASCSPSSPEKLADTVIGR